LSFFRNPGYKGKEGQLHDRAQLLSLRDGKCGANLSTI